jgi:sugar phosphate isomerase/epimerase
MCIGGTVKLGLSSLLFVRSSIEEAIRASADSGADAIEIIYDIPHFPPDYDQCQLMDLKELIDSHGLGVSVHASFWDLNPASHHREVLKLTLKQARQSIEACRALGGETVALNFGKCSIPEAKGFLEGAKRRYREFIEQCLPCARECGVALALENAGGRPDTYPSTVGELMQLVLEFEGAKITFDIGHAHLAERRAGKGATGESIAKAVENLREHLVHVHVHDNHGEHDEHLLPGDGDIDFKPVASALRSINYGGLLIAELWDPERPLETARKGMEKLGSIFKIS